MSNNRDLSSLQEIWGTDKVENLFYVKGRIGWRGLRRANFIEHGPYLITGMHIADGRVQWEQCFHIPEKKFLESPEIIVQSEDLVITKDGTIGKVAYIDQLPGPTSLNSHLFLVRSKSDKVMQKFAYYVFNSERFQKFIEDQKTGSTLGGLSEHRFLRFLFPTPDSDEQKRITAILDSVDESIRQTEAIIIKLKQIKAGLLHDLLTCGVDENGELRDPVAHPEQFHETKIGLTPNKWDIASIDSLAPHVKSGITPTGGSKVYLTDGILFVRSQNVTFEGLLLEDVAYIDEKTHLVMRRSEIFPHDVLLNITGASIGRCCPVPEGFGKANVNQHVCAIRILEPNREDALLLSNILASPIGQQQVFRLNSGGNRQGLNYEQIRKFLIPWPQSSDERKQIALIIEEQENQLHTEQVYLAKLIQLKQGLMQDLLTGSVRVNEIYLDLPEV